MQDPAENLSIDLRVRLVVEDCLNAHRQTPTGLNATRRIGKPEHVKSTLRLTMI
jgi:hypothetical protein